ncbi:hypothetical protein FRC12_005482 [Ceratobasidium sp. 428]|nr:hypothetical protein FRC12_005482 [Ceratobasidium sp. 428]
MFYEAAALTYNPTEPGSKPVSKVSGKSLTLKRDRLTKEPLKKGGWKSTTFGAHPALRPDSPYEGTLALVQTRGCLRQIWTTMFQNQPIKPVVPCCSSETCNPELLNLVKLPKPTSSSKSVTKKAPKRGLPHAEAQERLVEWRTSVWERDYPDETWGPSAILYDDYVDFLSSIGGIPSYDYLKQNFAARYSWGWWDKYGQELADIICKLDIPYTPTPRKPRRQPPKRRAPEPESGQDDRSKAPKANSSAGSIQPNPSSSSNVPLRRSTRARKLTQKAAQSDADYEASESDLSV